MRFLLLLLLALPASAASLITATFTVTNAPTTNYVDLNGSDVRLITNAWSATTILSNSSVGGLATNFYRHSVTNPFTSQFTVTMPATNQVKIVFNAGAAVVFTTRGWASVGYGTNTVGSNVAVRWPIGTEPSLAMQTNVVSDLVTNIFLSSTNTFPGTTFALTNFVSRTNHNQTVIGSIIFSGTNVFHGRSMIWSNGYIIGATNIGGMISNAAINEFQGSNRVANEFVTNLQGMGSATLSNLVARGIPFMAFSNESTSVIIGTNANAISNNGVAIGIGAFANSAGVSVGRLATNNYVGVAIGSSAYSSNQYDVALGAGAIALGGNSVALGPASVASHAESVAIGKSAQTTQPYQIRLGAGFGSVSTASPIFANSNIVIGNGEYFNLPAGLAGALYATNGTLSSIDPTNAGWLVPFSGEWRYRASSAIGGSGGTRYLHNIGAETNGSGTDYSLTTSTAQVDFGGTDPLLTLPSAGTYLLIANTVFSGATAADSIVVKLRDNDDAADVPNSSRTISAHSTGANQVTLQSIYTASGANRIDLFAHNATGARGTITSTQTKIIFVRLY